jgi:hypothetical protein
MAIAGAILLMARYKAIRLQAAENWEEEYHISTQPKVAEEETPEEMPVVPPAPRAKRVLRTTAKSTAVKKVSANEVVAKEPAEKKKTAQPKKSP